MSVLFLSLALLAQSPSNTEDTEKAEDSPAVRTVDLVAAAAVDGKPPLLNICTKGNIWVHFNVEELRAIAVFAEALESAERSAAQSVASDDSPLAKMSFSEWGISSSNIDWIAATGVMQLRYDAKERLGERTSFNYAFTSWATVFHDSVDWDALGLAIDDAIFKKLLGTARLLVPSDKRKLFLTAIQDGTTPTCFAGIAKAKREKKNESESAKRGRELFHSATHELTGEDYAELVGECVDSLVAFVYVCDPETDASKIVDLDKIMRATKLLACRVDRGEDETSLVLRLDFVPRNDVGINKFREQLTTFVSSNVKAENMPRQALAALEAGKVAVESDRVVWTLFVPGILRTRE